MKRIFDEINHDNTAFKKYIVEEYVEFFKNKKKIRLEWSNHATETEKKIDDFIKLMSTYDRNISSLNTVVPILVELSCLVSKFS